MPRLFTYMVYYIIIACDFGKELVKRDLILFFYVYVLCHGYTNIMVCVCVVAYFILITNYCARVRGPRSLCARTRILFWKLFISKIKSVCVCRLYIEANDRTWQIFWEILFSSATCSRSSAIYFVIVVFLIFIYLSFTSFFLIFYSSIEKIILQLFNH